MLLRKSDLDLQMIKTVSTEEAERIYRKKYLKYFMSASLKHEGNEPQIRNVKSIVFEGKSVSESLGLMIQVMTPDFGRSDDYSMVNVAQGQSKVVLTGNISDIHNEKSFFEVMSQVMDQRVLECVKRVSIFPRFDLVFVYVGNEDIAGFMEHCSYVETFGFHFEILTNENSPRFYREFGKAKEKIDSQNIVDQDLYSENDLDAVDFEGSNSFRGGSSNEFSFCRPLCVPDKVGSLSFGPRAAVPVGSTLRTFPKFIKFSGHNQLRLRIVGFWIGGICWYLSS